MNNSLRETMCARLALVQEPLSDSEGGIELKLTRTLEQARQLLHEVQKGNADKIAIARSELEVFTMADEMHHAIKYLDYRLKLIYEFLSETENALLEREP